MEGLIILNSQFWKSVICITINPLFWNVIAQIEYYKHTCSSLFGGRKKLAVTVLAILILLLNVLRSLMFERTVHSQPHLNHFSPISTILGISLLLIGQVFTLSSFWKLGFYPTFLGDYFGLFMHDAPITSFPFNVMDDPMYWGSTLSYLGIAVSENSPCGIVLTAWVAVVYKIAIWQEGKMLKILYAQKKT
jgi:phosphatidylethanolamine/phosphatidyl-N-methylethanolamine N-methyltransferase